MHPKFSQAGSPHPRTEKPQLALEILELLFTANAAFGFDRLNTQKQIDLKLKILKTIIRLSHDVRAIDERHYLELSEALVEIGRMLGGWINSAQKTTDTRKPRA